MTRRIRISQVGDYIDDQMEKLLRAAVLETDNLLKQSSPVDTGRFRASWQVGENAAGFYDAGPQQSPVNADRGLTSPPVNPNPPLRRLNYEKERTGNVYSVHNNLPYAEKLAAAPVGKGGSKQTGGPGWVQSIAKDVQTRVMAKAAQIGRES